MHREFHDRRRSHPRKGPDIATGKAERGAGFYRVAPNAVTCAQRAKEKLAGPLGGVQHRSLKSVPAERDRFPLPLSAARIALTVTALGILTSKGNAFSAATRTSNIRTAPDTETLIPASVFAAFCLVSSSTRTKTLAGMSVAVSGAVRMLLVRVAAEKALPFE